MTNRRIFHVLGHGNNSPILIDGKLPEDIDSLKSATAIIVDLERIAASKPYIWKGEIKGRRYFSGFLSNLDARGHKMTFSYAAKGSSWKEALDLLVEDINKNGYSLDEQTLKSFNKHSTLSLVFASITLLIIILILLFTLC